VGIELPDKDKYEYAGWAETHQKLVTTMEVCNAAGLCMFGYLSYPVQAIPEQLAAVTGWDFDMDDMFKTGRRIFTMRHAFNLREGINPLKRNMPGRLVGDPPLTQGNVKDVVVDYQTLAREFLELVDWDVDTTVPSVKSLQELGMEFLISDLT
jgi:aldehyde:ferredoxin oxidoreductase